MCFFLNITYSARIENQLMFWWIEEIKYCSWKSVISHYGKMFLIVLWAQSKQKWERGFMFKYQMAFHHKKNNSRSHGQLWRSDSIEDAWLLALFLPQTPAASSHRPHAGRWGSQLRSWLPELNLWLQTLVRPSPSTWQTFGKSESVESRVSNIVCVCFILNYKCWHLEIPLHWIAYFILPRKH